MNDEYYMQLCLDLAQKGEGSVSPQPLRAALLVRDDVIIRACYHEKYGNVLPEIRAINECLLSGERTNELVLYSNMSPTSDIEKIIEKHSLKRTVFAESDGPLKESAREINRFYYHFLKEHRPFIQETSFIGSNVHYAKVDCVLVDQRLIREKDPDFMDPKSRNRPLRIVHGPLGGLDKNWKVLTDSFRRNTMIVSTESDILMNPEMALYLDSMGIARLACEDLEGLYKTLASLKLISVLKIN